MIDYVVMLSGWIAFGCLVAWLVSRKKVKPNEVVEFLDLLWDNPHIRAHLESEWEKIYKKFENKSLSNILKKWWND